MADEEIPRDHRWAVALAVIGIAFLALIWYWGQPTVFAFGLAAFLVFIVMGVFYLGLSYKGSRSRLYGLKPITSRMPAVTQPKGHVHFRTKMFWTIGILLMYFLLTNIYLFGVDQSTIIDLFASYRAILAGAQGTLMDLGIGPIVTGSIIMQLFTGAKIINLDLTDDEDKGTYQGTQKVLVIAMIFIEAVPQVFGYISPSASIVTSLGGVSPGNGMLLAEIIIIAQLVFGSYLVFLMDEVVSKWGIGSGISLFIAAGVSQQIVQGTLNWVPQNPSLAISTSNPPSGTIPKSIYFFTHLSASRDGRLGLGARPVTSAEPGHRARRYRGDLLPGRVDGVDADRAAALARGGAGRARALPLAADLRVEHPGHLNERLTRQRLRLHDPPVDEPDAHPLPADRPSMVDRVVPDGDCRRPR